MVQMPKISPYLGAGILLAMLFVHCRHAPSPVDNFVPTSTWEIIQHRIFEPSCVPCHSGNNSFARQSDLLLTKAEGYEQLMNREPVNHAAKADGLLILGKDGIKSLNESYLWEKINASNAEHYFTDHPEYGALMPPGGPYLSKGELAYIREWILAGAPKEGFVVDEQWLLDDRPSGLEVNETHVLAPPEQGFQLHLGPFEVEAGEEREFFYYQPLHNPEDLYIRSFEVSMSPGSHHFILYRFEEKDRPDPLIFRDVYKDNGDIRWSTLKSMRGRIFILGSPYRFHTYNFPEGVALRLPPNDGLDLNSHYINKHPNRISGEVWVNVHTVPKSEVLHEAHPLYLENQEIVLPAHRTTILSKTFLFEERRYIFALFSHAHKFNESFKIYLVGGTRDGEMVYFTRDWEHPYYLTLDPPLVREAGTGLRAVASYHNPTGKKIKFGLSGEEDEMMIILGAYYTD